MKFENTEVWGFKHALRGMRNPLESWDKSDSLIEDEYEYQLEVGKNDLDLAQRLIKAGEPHRKFMRQIFVSVDITAPIYWWKEFDTYKVGTVANSTSTMHKLASTPITKECFEMGDFDESPRLECKYVKVSTGAYWEFYLIPVLENLRQKYNETKDKCYWKELIRLLPESWLQKRTVTMNYENILNMITYRQNHKLSEWSESFINWAKTLPYADEFFSNKQSYNK